ncbi:phosphotransferase [Paenibacillus herberti]|uniref:phosphotransferase n=1 Tax=Paenibacillus herberti TaxID=1619309 RepID=UPI001595EB7A|nr:phosphotransferase [Paenibacillus herberti]
MKEKIDELLSHYFKITHYEIQPVPFGLTNITKFLTIDNNKYVVRIYNSHTKNVQSIKLEAEITTFLNSSNLSFEVPAFLPTLARNQYIHFRDRTLGAVVSFIEGTIPEMATIQQAENFGSVVGEVSSALLHFKARDTNYKGMPFSRFNQLHPLADFNNVDAFFNKPPFHIPSKSMTFYQEMISTLERKIHLIDDLPKQFVHHDLLIYNLLATGDRMSGVLDFDFTSLDVSFMEFVISLNHILQLTDGSWKMVEAYIKGYSQFRKCTSHELNQLQLLTQLYHIAVLHIYIGQQYSGVDIEQNFNYILNQFITRNDWLNNNGEKINKLIAGYLL